MKGPPLNQYHVGECDDMFEVNGLSERNICCVQGLDVCSLSGYLPSSSVARFHRTKRFNWKLTIQAVLALLAMSDPSRAQEWPAIISTFLDEGGTEKVISELKSDGYNCAMHGDIVSAGGRSSRLDFFGPEQYNVGNQICWRGNDGLRVYGDIIEPNGIAGVDYVMFDKPDSGPRMAISCKALSTCSGSVQEFRTTTLDLFSISANGETHDGRLCGDLSSAGTFCLDTMSSVQELEILWKSSKQLGDDIAKYSDLQSLGPLFEGPVSKYEFSRFIELSCSQTVDCSDHQKVTQSMLRSYAALKTSTNIFVQGGYLDACIEGIMTIKRLPSTLWGEAGIYEPQFIGCNTALYYHFEQDQL